MAHHIRSTEEIKAAALKAVALVEKGASYREATKATGISHHAISAVAAVLGVKGKARGRPVGESPRVSAAIDAVESGASVADAAKASGVSESGIHHAIGRRVAAGIAAGVAKNGGAAS
jgi:transposase